MSLQFNPGAYESAFQYGQNRDDRRRQQFEQSLQAIPQGLAQIANIQQQKKKDLMDQLTLQYQADANARENRKFESEYGTPINPNSMEGLPTGQVGQSSFMPGGQGQVGTGSPLIQAFEKWRANGMQSEGARPEFMGALAKDERKAFYDQNDPKNLADINLKNAQAEYYRNRPTDPIMQPETYTILGQDMNGNIIQVGSKSGTRRVIPNSSGPVYPTHATDAQSTAAGYGDRATAAHKIINDLFNGGKLNPNDLVFAAQEASLTPNIFKSGNIQSLDQAKRNFLNAILRRESGAVISPSEFEEGTKQYFPVYGDTPETIRQKDANRNQQIINLSRSAGPMSSPISRPPQQQQETNRPSVVIQNGHRYIFNPVTGQYE